MGAWESVVLLPQQIGDVLVSFQKHHVINLATIGPSTFLTSLETLNLWNSNDYSFNGLSLPSTAEGAAVVGSCVGAHAVDLPLVIPCRSEGKNRRRSWRREEQEDVDRSPNDIWVKSPPLDPLLFAGNKRHGDKHLSVAIAARSSLAIERAAGAIHGWLYRRGTVDGGLDQRRELTVLLR